MWFRKITAGAFGHLKDESLSFGRGLNIIHGPNESGKSTWHAALVVALCGQRHGSGRTRAERDFKNRRQPWDSPGRWGVTVELTLRDGRLIEIDRDLRLLRTRVLDIGIGGKEIDDNLMNQGSPDGARWLGLDRTTFPMTASISQADTLSILDLTTRDRKVERDALQESLARAAAGGAGATAAGAVERIRRFASENVGLNRRNATKPLRRAIDSVKSAEQLLARTRQRREVYVDLARQADRKRREVHDLERRQSALQAWVAKDEYEASAKELTEKAIRLERWERRFPQGDPRSGEEVEGSDLMIALNRVRSAPKPVGTDLEALEVLEGRLAELALQKRVLCAINSLEEAEEHADQLRREVDRLEEWEGRFPDGDPRRSQLASLADLASAVARCNSLPSPGFTDIDPRKVLEERLALLDESTLKPCPGRGDVQRWIIPLREAPPPSKEKIQSRIEEARKTRGSPPRSGGWGRRVALGVVVGVTVFAGLVVAGEPLYGALAGAAAGMGTMFLFRGASKPDGDASAQVADLDRQLREREAFDVRIAEAHRSLREWNLPLDPDAAIVEFYNRERDWRDQTTERRRLEERMARRKRFDEEEAMRRSGREAAFEELRNLVSRYGGDVSGDDSQVMGEARLLLSDFRRLERQRQDEVAEWGRFQEALGGLSMEEWKTKAEDASQVVETARDEADLLLANLTTPPMGRENIGIAQARLEELVARRRRFDEEAARRSTERESAFEELRRVVVSHGGDGLRDEERLLRAADDLVGRFKRRAEDRRGAIAGWGRFQEALGGVSLEQWRSRAAQAERQAQQLRIRADKLAADLDPDLMKSNRVSAALQETDARLADAIEEAGRTSGQLEQIEGDLVDVAAAQATLARAKCELQRVRRLETTLNTATEHLQKAAERAHRLLAPRMEGLMGEWISALTKGRYVGVLVDPETLRVRLRQPDGAIREAALLSHGTAEQAYLLLRVVLAQVLAEGHEPCPVLLDDSTVHADVDRKEQVLEYLLQASHSHQVILFTHDEAVARWAQGRRANQNIKLLSLAVPASGAPIS